MASLVRSAFVIARRDFTATVFSRAFLLFLVGPLFPVLMGVIFGTIGGATMSQAERPTIAVLASGAEFRALAAARERLERAAKPAVLIELRRVAPRGDPAEQRARLLESSSPPIIGVLEGGLSRPRLTGPLKANAGFVRQVEFLIEEAHRAMIAPSSPAHEVQLTTTS